MKNDWWTCSGESVLTNECVSRRKLLMGAALGSLAWWTRESALGQMTVRTDPSSSNEVLVVIFLRGGADGLNVVVPYGEDNYYRLRPSLGIASPTDKRAAAKDRTLDLDGFFGMHPALSPLLPLYIDGILGFGHACGSFDDTRSHFDAMSAMERGLPRAEGTVSSGWLARHLEAAPRSGDLPLRAVAFGNVMPDFLRGAPSAVAMESLSDYRLQVPESEASAFLKRLEALYSNDKDAVGHAGKATLAAMRKLQTLDSKGYAPSANARYPASDLGAGLRQVALLVKSGVGLEVACLDKGGWDTHVAQGNSTGWQASLLTDLAESLSAFAADLGPHSRHVTTVVMTEFGRRAYENSGLGTDHGRGSFMIVMGGSVRGGKVHSQWPGLSEEQLEGPGDLRVTTDYRNVLGEILEKRLHNPLVSEVFPGLQYTAPGWV